MSANLLRRTSIRGESPSIVVMFLATVEDALDAKLWLQQDFEAHDVGNSVVWLARRRGSWDFTRRAVNMANDPPGARATAVL